MKIVLLFPEWTGSYNPIIRHFARRSSTWPPLNLALLASIAEQRGHNVSIIDGEAEGASIKKIVQRAVAQKPDLIALTATSPFFHINKDVGAMLKTTHRNIPVVIGGPHITIMKEKAFYPMFDYAFVGEAENSWPTFLEQYENGKDVSEVRGILFRRSGEIISTGQPDDITELDNLPFPARHLLPMRRYKLGTLLGRKNFTSIQTMRGCPWKCIFCASEALKTTSMRVRSPRSVVDEIKSVVAEFGIRHFHIVDDVMTLWRQHIVEICDLLDQEGLSITFEGSTRANLVDETLLSRMAKSGLIRLSFGLETVDSEMRKTMKKQVPLEHYVKANAICNQYGVEALNSVMLGLPGETQETVRQTLDFLGNSRDVKQANFAIAIPYPGTEFHEMARDGNHGIELMTQDFSEYRRYGSAVTSVNGLTPQDLVELQNEGFVRIYSAPWRWKPMIKKQGILGGILTLLRVVRLAIRKVIPRTGSKVVSPISKNPMPSSLTDLHVGMSGTFNGKNSTGVMAIEDGAGRLIQIPRRKKSTVAAGHYGTPKNPNG